MSAAASLLLHVVAGLFFLKIIALLDQRVEPRLQFDKAETITIQHLVKPTPAPPKPHYAPPAVIRYQPKPQVVPSHVPVPERHELHSNRIVANAPPIERPNVPPRPGRPQFSAQQLARIESHLAATIADARSGIDPVRVPPEPIAAPKHYSADFSAFDGAIGRHHGLCDPTTSWKDGGWDYYYVACNVHFPDGHTERQGVPWPIRFQPNDDPFNGTTNGREKPLAPPLPGWHLQPGQTVSDQLRDYAHEKGVDI